MRNEDYHFDIDAFHHSDLLQLLVLRSRNMLTKAQIQATNATSELGADDSSALSVLDGLDLLFCARERI